MHLSRAAKIITFKAEADKKEKETEKGKRKNTGNAIAYH